MKTTEIIYISKKGLKELKKHIARLDHHRSIALQELRDLDKTDSHEDRLARIEKLAALDAIESELVDKRHALAHAKLFPRKRDALRVAIGSVVDIIDTQGRLASYTIVDTFEANPSDGRISVQSPLGRSLLGKQIQDSVQWSNGLRSNKAQLVNIT
jgi:transcription elongation factor GreA